MLMNFNLVVAVAEGLTEDQVRDKLRQVFHLGMDAEPLSDISLQNIVSIKRKKPRLSEHEIPVQRWLSIHRRQYRGLRLQRVNERWYRAVYDGETACTFIARSDFGKIIKIKRGDVFAVKTYAEPKTTRKLGNVFAD